MGMDPNLTVLVYENGMGVYIHKLFARKYRIKPGTEVHPSVLLKHEVEIPHEERTRMQSWIHPDDREILARGRPVFYKHIRELYPYIQSEVESS